MRKCEELSACTHHNAKKKCINLAQILSTILFKCWCGCDDTCAPQNACNLMSSWEGGCHNYDESLARFRHLPQPPFAVVSSSLLIFPLLCAALSEY